MTKLKTRFQIDSERLHVEEFMPTTREPLKEHTWIKAPSVETWISFPPFNEIPFKNFYIESSLIVQDIVLHQ
jgi:hypothetical protein